MGDPDVVYVRYGAGRDRKIDFRADPATVEANHFVIPTEKRPADCRSRSPQGAQVHRWVAGLPAAQEALDRRVEHDALELVDREQPMPLHGGVLRGHRLERAPAEVAGEDDVDDVLRGEAPDGRDRVDDRDGALDRQLLVDSDLLRELAVQGVDEALARVHAAAREEPVLLAGLLVAAEEHAVAPAQDRGHADPRLGSHRADEPNPRTPRSLAGSSSTSSSSSSATGTTRSCAIRIPGSTTNACSRSVFSRITCSSPR